MSLASVANVRNAGNLSKKIDEDVIEFWIDVASYMLEDAVGSELYAYVTAHYSTYPRLVKAEILMSVALCLPCIAIVSSGSGIMKNLSLGSEGYLEVLSPTKEILSLASYYSTMADQFVAPYISDKDKYGLVWHSICQRVFPSLDEYPTQGTIGSDEESDIFDYRGTKTYEQD